jgi:hypothetical protein
MVPRAIIPVESMLEREQVPDHPVFGSERHFGDWSRPGGDNYGGIYSARAGARPAGSDSGRYGATPPRMVDRGAVGPRTGTEPAGCGSNTERLVSSTPRMKLRSSPTRAHLQALRSRQSVPVSELSETEVPSSR